MARKIFVAATGQNCGKTTTSLSILHMARRHYQRVGFIKPLGPKPAEYQGRIADKDAILMAQVFGLERDLPLMSPVVLMPGDTQRVLDGEVDPETYRTRMVSALQELEARTDFLIIEGAGHSGVGSVIGMSNAEVARLSGAGVMMVAGGGVGNVVDAVYMNLALFEKLGVPVRAVVANKLVPEKRDKTLHYLRLAFAGEPFKVLGGFNYQPILADPTLRRISKLLDLELRASEEESARIVHHIQIGAASTQRVAELLQDSTVVIVTSSRDELLVTLANLYQLPEYQPLLAGLIIPGVSPLSSITRKILDRSGIPYMRTDKTTVEVFTAISEDVSKLTAEDTHKIELIQTLTAKRFDFDVIDALFA